jgi:hypothetical protein
MIAAEIIEYLLQRRVEESRKPSDRLALIAQAHKELVRERGRNPTLNELCLRTRLPKLKLMETLLSRGTRFERPDTHAPEIPPWEEHVGVGELTEAQRIQAAVRMDKAMPALIGPLRWDVVRRKLGVGARKPMTTNQVARELRVESSVAQRAFEEGMARLRALSPAAKRELRDLRGELRGSKPRVKLH